MLGMQGYTAQSLCASRFEDKRQVSEDEKNAVGAMFEKDLKQKGRDRGALKTKVVLRGNNKGGTVTKGMAPKVKVPCTPPANLTARRRRRRRKKE